MRCHEAIAHLAGALMRHTRRPSLVAGGCPETLVPLHAAHRPKQFLAYFGGNPNYHAMLAHEVENNFPGFVLS